MDVVVGNAEHVAAARTLHDRLLPEVRSEFWHRSAVDETALFLAATEGARLIGYLYGETRGLSETSSYVRELAVDPEAQGRGVGRALLGGFARAASRQGYKAIFVDVPDGGGEEGLIVYYERCGFYDPTRWRTTLHDRRGRNTMLVASPAALIAATDRWAPRLATNAWDVDGFGNAAFYDAYVVPAYAPPAETGQIVSSWLADPHRDHRVVDPLVLAGSRDQAESAGAKDLTGVCDWTTNRRFVPAHHERRAVIALWLAEAQLLGLDANRLAPLVVVASRLVPASEWTAARGATDILTGEPGRGFRRCEDPVVEIALRSLSLSINRGSGLAAPERPPRSDPDDRAPAPRQASPRPGRGAQLRDRQSLVRRRRHRAAGPRGGRPGRQALQEARPRLGRGEPRGVAGRCELPLLRTRVPVRPFPSPRSSFDHDLGDEEPARRCAGGGGVRRWHSGSAATGE